MSIFLVQTNLLDKYCQQFMLENNLSTRLNQSLDPPTLASRAYQAIKLDILNGRLEQGAKIVESDLALKYGISRGPLREAIHRLEQMKLILRVPHAGSRVVSLDMKMMQDIYTAREPLEGMAARLAARLMSDEDLDDLFKSLEHPALDFDFHLRILSACDNQWILEKLNGELYQLIRLCRNQSRQTPEQAQTAFNQHLQIANAIAERDAELADLLMRRHISSVWTVVQPSLKNRNN